MYWNKSKLSSVRLQEKEVGCSKHLPYAYLEEHDIIRTKNGDYLAVIKIEGLAWDTLVDQEVNFEQIVRAKLFSTLTDSRFAIYYTIIRSKVSMADAQEHEVWLGRQLHATYYAQLQSKPLFVNDLYLTIVLKGEGSKGNRVTSRINSWLANLSHGLNKKQAENSRTEAIKTLNEVVLRIITGLEKYRPRKLSLYKTDKAILSEQLNFFSRILNWDNQSVLAVNAGIDSYLPKRRLFFGARAIESIGNGEHDSRFASMLSLKEYPNNTFPGMMDYLLQLPVEMVVTQSFVLQHRQQSREELELQLRRLRQSRDPDSKGMEQLQQALGCVVAGEFGFGYHHLTVMVIAANLHELEQQVAQVDKHLTESGIVAVREWLNLEAAFWAQFPGNFRYIVRKMPITTDNFAAFSAMNNNPVGTKTGNHWGEAVALLKTPGNMPYYFNFHPRNSDVGHTLILGMTGSGKTLLSCFLLACSLKYQSRIFYFDKDYGAEVFMRGLGADYSVLGTGSGAGLNPLQLPDTPRNRRFLADWLASLLSAFGDTLLPEDLDIIHHAVRLNYEQLKPEQRTLANLAEAFGTGGPGTLRNRIDQWHSDQHLGEFFGAQTDNLHLDTQFFCFEMGQMLEKSNRLALPSVLLYLFHRIELVLDENTQQTPTIICLDEAWALLDNPIFAQSIKNWLKTFRKRNAIVLLLSQELTDITKAEISHSINAETATKIFFPDATPVNEVYRNVFQLSDREISLLKEYSVEKRHFLIKQPNESTFASLDLSGMLDWIPVLSSNTARIQLLRTLLQQYGAQPEQWLPVYLEQVKYVNK